MTVHLSKCSPYTILLVLVAFVPLIPLAQSVPDKSFHYVLQKPQYQPGAGSYIAFDEYHNNPHTLKGVYFPFNKLVGADGYVVQPVREEITSALLKKFRIYVTVNATFDAENWDLPVQSAFKETEVDAIYEWVKEGGSLLLITDHMPCGGSANLVASRFGFHLINGFALRNDRKPEIFSKAAGTLQANILTTTPGATVDSIRIWGGTGFTIPKKATIISSLGAGYTIYTPTKVANIEYPIADSVARVPGKGFVNGAFMKYGKGRIIVFGDSAPFTAQLQGISSDKRGMNHPDASQNVQLLLNIIHWLDRKL
ncbi:MAG: hypothetical protein ABIN01_06280 [Ferruginibacter sp.]